MGFKLWGSGRRALGFRFSMIGFSPYQFREQA